MSLQILVVENHGDTRRALTGLLGHFGHSISAADTVESGKAFVRAKQFDAIVSDVGLPDGRGEDVIREAKRRQRLTAIALTSGDKVEQLNDAREFDWYLRKPVDFAQLRQVLGQIASVHSGSTNS